MDIYSDSTIPEIDSGVSSRRRANSHQIDDQSFHFPHSTSSIQLPTSSLSPIPSRPSSAHGTSHDDSLQQIRPNTTKNQHLAQDTFGESSEHSKMRNRPYLSPSLRPQQSPLTTTSRCRTSSIQNDQTSIIAEVSQGDALPTAESIIDDVLSTCSATGSIVSIGQYARAFVGGLHHAPSYMHAHHIDTGYRLNHRSVRDCLRSLFKLHNETCNIYTHLVAFFMFIVLMIYRYNTILYLIEDRLLFRCFIGYYIGIACCLLFSTAFHLFSCIDQHTHDRLYSLDMSGICMMIMVSYQPPMLIAFYCTGGPAGPIYGGVIFTIALISLVMQNTPYFLQPKWLWFRIITLALQGVYAFIPFVHFYNIATPFQFSTLSPAFAWTAFWYIVGFIFFVTKFPECLFRSTLDLSVYSHGLWHTSICFAALVLERGFTQALVHIVSKQWCPIVPPT